MRSICCSEGPVGEPGGSETLREDLALAAFAPVSAFEASHS